MRISLHGATPIYIVYTINVIQTDPETFHATIAEIKPETIENILKNWITRMDYWQVSRGRHFTEINFLK